MATRFTVKKYNGKWSDKSRLDWKEQLGQLENGQYDVQIKSKSGRFTPTRYKYYFACLLPCIFLAAQRRFKILKDRDLQSITTTAELHVCLKAEYNPVTIVDVDTGASITTYSSTTNLSDQKFIGVYLEKIIHDFIQMPDCPDILMYEDWKKAHKEGNWEKVKTMIEFYQSI